MRPIRQAEYDRIEQLVPIACVDLLVVNGDTEEVLLIRRKNPPCAGQWWFPGGRILHGERRADAVIRKLWQECGLLTKGIPYEKGTYEFIFGAGEKHSITTVYEIGVSGHEVVLDDQSDAYEWKTRYDWLKDERAPDWIRGRLT